MSQVVSGTTTSLVSVTSFNPFGPPSVIPIPPGHPPPLILRQTIPLPLQPLRLQAPAQPKKPLAQRENQPIAAKNVSPNVAERAKRKIKPKKVWEPDSSPQNKHHQASVVSKRVEILQRVDDKVVTLDLAVPSIMNHLIGELSPNTVVF
jgi:hypothetical protein